MSNVTNTGQRRGIEMNRDDQWQHELHQAERRVTRGEEVMAGIVLFLISAALIGLALWVWLARG